MVEATAYIQQQLEQRKLKAALTRFLYLPFRGSKLRYELAAYNQLLFVEVARLPEGARIVSDSNAMNVTNRNHRNAWEDFSGLVSIELAQPLDEGGIELIQVYLA